MDLFLHLTGKSEDWSCFLSVVQRDIGHETMGLFFHCCGSIGFSGILAIKVVGLFSWILQVYQVFNSNHFILLG